MCVLYLSRVEKAAVNLGIEEVNIAADILKMVIELHNNENIYCELLDRYGSEPVNSGLKRKINWLIQEFIVQNHFNEFIEFCEKNGVTIFNEDLETDKRYASNARLLFVIFLREVLQFKPSMRIVDDRETDC